MGGRARRHAARLCPRRPHPCPRGLGGRPPLCRPRPAVPSHQVGRGSAADVGFHLSPPPRVRLGHCAAWHDRAMHIGLIGGIGPAATVVYYDRLTRRVREAGGRLELTIVQADVQDLIANVLADRRQEQAEIYAGPDRAPRGRRRRVRGDHLARRALLLPRDGGDLAAAAGERGRAARRGLRVGRPAAGRAAGDRGRDADEAVRPAGPHRGGRARTETSRPWAGSTRTSR